MTAPLPEELRELGQLLDAWMDLEIARRESEAMITDAMRRYELREARLAAFEATIRQRLAAETEDETEGEAPCP